MRTMTRILAGRPVVLTDDQRIGYESWPEDASVFLRRAAMWNAIV